MSGIRRKHDTTPVEHYGLEIRNYKSGYVSVFKCVCGGDTSIIAWVQTYFGIYCSSEVTRVSHTLSRVSPGASSSVCPNSKKSSMPLANARREWPPDTSSTRNGNSTCWSILTVRAWASMWWIGMKGFSCCFTKLRLKCKPTLRLNARPGLTVVATAASSRGVTLLLSKASCTTLLMFSLWRSWAMGGMIPPALWEKPHY